MSDISTLLDSLYANDTNISQLDKTAEDHLLAELQGEGEAGHNPYTNMSDAELIALLQDDGVEKTASAEQADLEKTAAEMLGGQVMAHSMVHEIGLIKEAMLNGLCRVCKTSPMDVQGSSICSGCLEDAA